MKRTVLHTLLRKRRRRTEEVESFREWMGFVNRCLSGRLTQEDTGGDEKEEVGVTHT